MSILESMSNGTPVIVREAGGSAESVETTGGGLVYRHTDELLPLLDRLAGDVSLRQCLGEKARRGVELHFTEERWMTDYLGLVDSIRDSKTDAGDRKHG